MSKKKMTVDELISFFEMSVKVEGWDNPEPSPSYQAVKAFRELVAENAGLKAQRDEAFKSAINAALRADDPKPDPLSEMWRELSEYQEQANTNGHGESWARMCSERTEDAAEIAKGNARVASISSGLTEPWVAAMSARWAVAWRQHSEQNTQQAIDAIRRAKEAKR